MMMMHGTLNGYDYGQAISVIILCLFFWEAVFAFFKHDLRELWISRFMITTYDRLEIRISPLFNQWNALMH
ncbi:hypothetical protein BDV30DRAFT_155469 [Aspergillus minisclerotigenes]|uniref:Uncharacterized protein n=1 Tax=Aspergillus minisclerotigenes TaxID=656917 RepID=A0A5N6JGW2_9EURO|nr:hypothetical protein BDV30DRAFT_155469 [Aspergillus minisclerotigenes]